MNEHSLRFALSISLWFYLVGRLAQANLSWHDPSRLTQQALSGDNRRVSGCQPKGARSFFGDHLQHNTGYAPRSWKWGSALAMNLISTQ
jgi:hypothetical protein